MKSNVITRFPPSPTGYLHIGNTRTMLYSYLFARHSGGEMIFRFEDTDRERSKKEFEDDILESLRWLGIEYRLPPIFRQSERTDIYKHHLGVLIERGLAYEAEESTAAPGMNVIRFKNPNKTIVFEDLIRGEVSFDTTELGDFIIARSHELPLYHLAVIIDDAEGGVTHVIRGEDHISNTPRQILMIEALGFTRPQYAHIPLILAPDRTKLSKRHGAVSVNQYRAEGFIAEAMLNYLAFLGWNPGGEQEVFTPEELIVQFDLSRVHKGGAIFDIEKFSWFNREHLKRLSTDEFRNRYCAWAGTTKELPPKAWELLKNSVSTLMEAKTQIEAGQFSFLSEITTPSADLLIQGSKVDTTTAKKHLEKITELIQPVESFTTDAVKEAVFPYATEQGRAGVLWPMRVALSGKEKSPDPFTLCELIGKEQALARIAAAALVL